MTKGQNTDDDNSQQNEEINANDGNEETDYQEDTETKVSNIFL